MYISVFEYVMIIYVLGGSALAFFIFALRSRRQESSKHQRRSSLKR